MEKLIITAAISGAEVSKEHNPNVPYTVEEIQREAYSAYKAGASIVHLHVRTNEGAPTQDKARFAECMAAIKEKCPDLIIQPSTGGAVGMAAEERLQPVSLKPEMATLSLGSVNFGGDELFVNTENDIIKFAAFMKEHGVRPECEIFDKGMIDMAYRLIKKGHIQTPIHFDFVMGVTGGIGGAVRDLTYLVDSIPAGCTWTVAGVGRAQLAMTYAAIAMGGHVRVGFEDNIYYSKGVLADSNGQFVERVVRVAKEFGREIATPDEARAIIGLPKRK